MEWGDRIPIGILYREEKPTFHDKISFLKDGPPLVDRDVDMKKIRKFMEEFN